MSDRDARRELAEYFTTIRNRLALAEKQIYEAIGAEHDTAVAVERVYGALKLELFSLRKEAEKLADELARLRRRAKRLVLLFANIARRKDLQAMRARVDAWNGESLVTRRELVRWLKEEFKPVLRN